uniref:Uncharacterized protein n=1 Tax=Salix viminalis TaxID=40686 RepID=A0A6N2KKG7_SALVM
MQLEDFLKHKELVRFSFETCVSQRSPVEQNIRGCVTWVSGNIKDRLDPAHFDAIFFNQTELREALLHQWKESINSTKKQGSESSNMFVFPSSLELILLKTKAIVRSSVLGTVKTVTVGGTGTNFNFHAITTPKLGIDDIISSKAIFPHHHAISSPANVTTDTNSRPDSGWKGKSSILLGDSIVNFAERCARLNPCSLKPCINCDFSKID